MAGTPPRFSTLPASEASRLTQRAAAASVAVALVLIGLKVFGWNQSGSIAILASLTDSILDLAASVFTFVAVRYAAAPPDQEHRFGHGKAEAFAGLFQAGLVAVSAGLLVVEAVRKAAAPEPQALTGTGVAVWVMIASTALTGALLWYQGRVVRLTGSIATKGDRAHYFSDLLSNLAVLVGIVIAGVFGWVLADAAAALFVALWLGHGAWGVARDAADHLMDRELPDADRARIIALARTDPAIQGVHDLRSRASGPFIHIQFHADLDPNLSLAQAHEIIVAAEQRILAAYPAADVIIHPDPIGEAEPHGNQSFATGHAAAE